MTTRVGPYRLDRTLGKGGFASVRLGIHDDGSEDAIKIISRNALNPDQQIKSEIALCKRLQHKNLVAYRSHKVTRKEVYLAMEYVPGGELYDKLEAAGKFTEDKARKIFAQLVDGVDYCHRNGVCHRDLKLENLLVASDGSIRITDFGFSKYFNDAAPKSVVGTALYVAPEIVLQDGQQYCGKSADIWSMGIILYLLTAGRFPFNRGCTGGVCPGMSRRAKDKFRTDNFRVPSHFSAPLTSLLRRILCGDPRQRATMQEIKSHPWWGGQMPGSDDHVDHPCSPPTSPLHDEIDWSEDEEEDSNIGNHRSVDPPPYHDFDSSDDELDTDPFYDSAVKNLSTSLAQCDI